MVSLLKRLTVAMGHDIGYESVITGVCTWQTQDVLVWYKKAGFLHSLVSESKRLQLKWRVSTTPKLTFWRQESYWDYSQEIINILHQVYLVRHWTCVDQIPTFGLPKWSFPFNLFEFCLFCCLQVSVAWRWMPNERHCVNFSWKLSGILKFSACYCLLLFNFLY